MPGYLLDTHAAVWLFEGNAKLSRAALAAIEAAERLSVSDVSLLELALLDARGILSLKPSPAAALDALADRLTVVPINAAIAADAVAVALPQRDPFDRVITATARVLGLTLITKDRQITEAGVVNTLW